jgi:hypothetical protein
MLACVLLSLTCLLVGCAGGLPAYRDFAYQQGWQESLVRTSWFTHRIWSKPGNSEANGDAGERMLHIYIEGDGKAWVNATTPALDPTSDSPLLFRLMADDPAPSLYVGRPCYLLTKDAGCDARQWTFRRYSDDVVNSLAGVIRRQAGARDLVLIGHSGGGTLATLLAPRLPNVKAVVTLAGNLDVAAWTSLHGYLPLTGSLDPAQQSPLPASIAQWHFSAEHDEVIPHETMPRFCERQTNARQLHCATVPDTTHVSGWQFWWKEFIGTLSATER